MAYSTETNESKHLLSEFYLYKWLDLKPELNLDSALAESTSEFEFDPVRIMSFYMDPKLKKQPRFYISIEFGAESKLGSGFTKASMLTIKILQIKHILLSTSI